MRVNNLWTQVYSRPTTLCSKKGSHQTFGSNFSNLNRFSKFFHCWK